jgi:CubicO group peptidase (beta-lactamase class C family)
MKQINCFFLFLLFFVNISSAQVNVNAAIQSKLDTAFKSTIIPGILIGVSINGKHQFFTAGIADKKNNQAFTPDTQFEIGSISKTFTAFILESVLQKKQIADSALILQFLPDSLNRNRNIASIQLVHLLNHTSGLPRLPDNMGTPEDLLQPYANYKKEDLYAYLNKAKVNGFGKVNYSNLGAGLAGVLAENISGKPYEYLLNKYINKPFHLKHTGIHADLKRPKAIGYFDKQEATYWDMNSLIGAGGIKSDATDMLNYLDYIANHQTLSIIQSVLHKTSEINKEVAIAKGWHTIEKNEETLLYWHNGGTYGFSTFCAFNPSNKNCIIIVINAFNKNTIADRLGINIMTKILN